MLNVYERRVSALRSRSTASVTLPFVAAPAQRVTLAAARYDELILRPGMSPRIPVAERGIVAKAAPAAAAAAASTTAVESKTGRFASAALVPQLVGPIRLATRPAAEPPAPEPAFVGAGTQARPRR
jgi:hypothetical protein